MERREALEGAEGVVTLGPVHVGGGIGTEVGDSSERGAAVLVQVELVSSLVEELVLLLSETGCTRAGDTEVGEGVEEIVLGGESGREVQAIEGTGELVCAHGE